MSKKDFRATWVDDLLAEHGLSPLEFAQRIGKPRQSVVQWQSGTKPTVPAMLAVMNAFGVDPGYFFINNLSTTEER
jgi:transcriptional regulator with XRE-family HTH domain